MWGIIYIIVVGFIAGMIAKWLSPGPNNPSGFILTTVLGIIGAALATFIGQCDRPLQPRPGCRIHHRDDRRDPRAVHLESAGGGGNPRRALVTGTAHGRGPIIAA